MIINALSVFLLSKPFFAIMAKASNTFLLSRGGAPDPAIEGTDGFFGVLRSCAATEAFAAKTRGSTGSCGEASCTTFGVVSDAGSNRGVINAGPAV